MTTQKTILVGINTGREIVAIADSMDELKELAIAAGADVVDSVIQNKDRYDAALLIGKGKVDEIKELVHFHQADIVIFNEELSGAQTRNLEERIGVPVIDRTALILDIFAVRAKTKIAKLQVELAQLKYRLPRLTGMGVAMSRTGGGIGTRGPGEQQLEIDRRRIRERIHVIGSQIKEANDDLKVQKSLRERNQVPVVALVGYTNAGKSTLMNAILTKTGNHDDDKKVFVKDMLFATLDTYSRSITLDDKKQFILSDTVGFVSKLPHNLVEAFKATLSEAVDADVLIHVIDSANPHALMQADVTDRVLLELGAVDKTIIRAYNKCDLTSERFGDGIAVSAITSEGIDELFGMIKRTVFSDYEVKTLVIPYDRGDIQSEIIGKYKPSELEYIEEGTQMTVELSIADIGRYSQYISS